MEGAVAQNITDIPIEECWIELDSDGTKMRYLQAGSGPPLLLVHGLMGGLFCWRFNIPALARHYTVYAVDLPGSGLSDAPPETDCGMQRHAARLLEFIEKLGLEHVNVVGASFGGGVAMLLAARDAQFNGSQIRLRSLVLAAPVNPWSRFGRGRIRFLSTSLGSFLLRLAMPLSRPVHRIALARLYGDPRRMRPGSVEGYSRLILLPGRTLNILNTLKNWQRDMETIRTTIQLIKVPTLLLWGTCDGAVELSSASRVKERISSCEFKTLPGVGHIQSEEMPEEFNQLVLDFLGGGKSN